MKCWYKKFQNQSKKLTQFYSKAKTKYIYSLVKPHYREILNLLMKLKSIFPQIHRQHQPPPPAPLSSAIVFNSLLGFCSESLNECISSSLRHILYFCCFLFFAPCYEKAYREVIRHILVPFSDSTFLTLNQGARRFLSFLTRKYAVCAFSSFIRSDEGLKLETSAQEPPPPPPHRRSTIVSLENTLQ